MKLKALACCFGHVKAYSTVSSRLDKSGSAENLTGTVASYAATARPAAPRIDRPWDLILGSPPCSTIANSSSPVAIFALEHGASPHDPDDSFLASLGCIYINEALRSSTGAAGSQAYRRLVFEEMVKAELNLLMEIRDTLISLSGPECYTPLLPVASIATNGQAFHRAQAPPGPGLGHNDSDSDGETPGATPPGTSNRPRSNPTNHSPALIPSQSASVMLEFGLEGLRLQPCWLHDAGSGLRRPGVVLWHRQPLSWRHGRAVALRNLGLLSHLDSAITLAACTGRVVYQNAASRRYYGRLIGLDVASVSRVGVGCDGGGTCVAASMPLRRAATVADDSSEWAGDSLVLRRRLRQSVLLQRLFSRDLEHLVDNMLAAWVAGRKWRRLLHVPPPYSLYGHYPSHYRQLQQQQQHQHQVLQPRGQEQRRGAPPPPPDEEQGRGPDPRRPSHPRLISSCGAPRVPSSPVVRAAGYDFDVSPVPYDVGSASARGRDLSYQTGGADAAAPAANPGVEARRTAASPSSPPLAAPTPFRMRQPGLPSHAGHDAARFRKRSQPSSRAAGLPRGCAAQKGLLPSSSGSAGLPSTLLGRLDPAVLSVLQPSGSLPQPQLQLHHQASSGLLPSGFAVPTASGPNTPSPSDVLFSESSRAVQLELLYDDHVALMSHEVSSRAANRYVGGGEPGAGGGGSCGSVRALAAPQRFCAMSVPSTTQGSRAAKIQAEVAQEVSPVLLRSCSADLSNLPLHRLAREQRRDRSGCIAAASGGGGGSGRGSCRMVMWRGTGRTATGLMEGGTTTTSPSPRRTRAGLQADDCFQADKEAGTLSHSHGGSWAHRWRGSVDSPGLGAAIGSVHGPCGGGGGGGEEEEEDPLQMSAWRAAMKVRITSRRSLEGALAQGVAHGFGQLQGQPSARTPPWVATITAASTTSTDAAVFVNSEPYSRPAAGPRPQPPKRSSTEIRAAHTYSPNPAAAKLAVSAGFPSAALYGGHDAARFDGLCGNVGGSGSVGGGGSVSVSGLGCSVGSFAVLQSSSRVGRRSSMEAAIALAASASGSRSFTLGGMLPPVSAQAHPQQQVPVLAPRSVTGIGSELANGRSLLTESPGQARSFAGLFYQSFAGMKALAGAPVVPAPTAPATAAAQAPAAPAAAAAAPAAAAAAAATLSPPLQLSSSSLPAQQPAASERSGQGVVGGVAIHSGTTGAAGTAARVSTESVHPVVPTTMTEGSDRMTMETPDASGLGLGLGLDSTVGVRMSLLVELNAALAAGRGTVTEEEAWAEERGLLLGDDTRKAVSVNAGNDDAATAAGAAPTDDAALTRGSHRRGSLSISRAASISFKSGSAAAAVGDAVSEVDDGGPPGTLLGGGGGDEDRGSHGGGDGGNRPPCVDPRIARLLDVGGFPFFSSVGAAEKGRLEPSACMTDAAAAAGASAPPPPLSTTSRRQLTAAAAAAARQASEATSRQLRVIEEAPEDPGGGGDRSTAGGRSAAGVRSPPLPRPAGPARRSPQQPPQQPPRCQHQRRAQRAPPAAGPPPTVRRTEQKQQEQRQQQQQQQRQPQPKLQRAAEEPGCMAATEPEEEENLRWHEVTASPFFDPITGQRMLLIVQADVTPRVEAERKLVELTAAQTGMLEQMFPRHVLEFVAQQGEAVGGMDFSAHVGAFATTHDLATVLFTDIVGFTTMSKQVPAAAVMSFLSELYSRLDALVDQYGVWKVETAGDCYIVAAGVVRPDEDGFHTVITAERTTLTTVDASPLSLNPSRAGGGGDDGSHHHHDHPPQRQPCPAAAVPPGGGVAPPCLSSTAIASSAVNPVFILTSQQEDELQAQLTAPPPRPNHQPPRLQQLQQQPQQQPQQQQRLQQHRPQQEPNQQQQHHKHPHQQQSLRQQVQCGRAPQAAHTQGGDHPLEPASCGPGGGSQSPQSQRHSAAAPPSTTGACDNRQLTASPPPPPPPLELLSDVTPNALCSCSVGIAGGDVGVGIAGGDVGVGVASGDVGVGVAGADLDPRRDAQAVFGFAVAMLKAVGGVRMPHNREPVQLRVGIHSGPLVSGVIGTKMPKFALFGDTMNTASRMESTCRPGCIQVSASTRALLPHLSLQPTGGIHIKGKGVMETYVYDPNATPGHGATGAAAAAACGAGSAATAANGLRPSADSQQALSAAREEGLSGGVAGRARASASGASAFSSSGAVAAHSATAPTSAASTTTSSSAAPAAAAFEVARVPAAVHTAGAACTSGLRPAGAALATTTAAAAAAVTPAPTQAPEVPYSLPTPHLTAQRQFGRAGPAAATGGFLPGRSFLSHSSARNYTYAVNEGEEAEAEAEEAGATKGDKQQVEEAGSAMVAVAKQQRQQEKDEDEDNDDDDGLMTMLPPPPLRLLQQQHKR